MSVFGERVFHHTSEDIHLTCSGDDLLADGIIYIVGVD
jgi:hypothetical protein